MKIHNPFKDLTRFELILWLCSAAVVSGTFVISPSHDYLNLADFPYWRNCFDFCGKRLYNRTGSYCCFFSFLWHCLILFQILRRNDNLSRNERTNCNS